MLEAHKVRSYTTVRLGVPIDASLLITTRDRASDLEVTLRELERQDTAGLEWELLVVDNGSSDRTAQVLLDARDRLPLRAFEQPVPGKNAALNVAIPVAHGNLLVFTDDDVTPATDWLKRLCAATNRWPDDSIFGGPIEPEFPEDAPAWLTAPDFSYASIAFARYAPGVPEGPVDNSPFGGNLALRRAVFQNFSFNAGIGPAGNSYAQGSEYELTRRMKDRGHRSIFVPDAPVRHRIRPDQLAADWLVQRAYRFGRGNERVHPTNPKRQLAGVPFKLWYDLSVTGFGRSLLALASQQRKLEAALDHAFVKGRIFEYRQRLAAEAQRRAEREA